MHRGRELIPPIRPLRALLIIVAISAVGACNWFSNKVQGSGRKVEDRRSVQDFTAVEVDGALEGQVVVGQPFSVVLAGDDNLLPLVSTEVRGGRLIVRMKDRVDVDPRAGLTATIHLPRLERAEVNGASTLTVTASSGVGPNLVLAASGASKVSAAGLKLESLKLEASGASHVEVTGSAGRLQAEVSGASHLAARELAVRTAAVEVSGASHAEVNGQEDVSGSASGAANVAVWGSPPRLAVSTSGAASVERMH
jgi:hypothetical protein